MTSSDPTRSQSHALLIVCLTPTITQSSHQSSKSTWKYSHFRCESACRQEAKWNSCCWWCLEAVKVIARGTWEPAIVVVVGRSFASSDKYDGLAEWHSSPSPNKADDLNTGAGPWSTDVQRSAEDIQLASAADAECVSDDDLTLQPQKLMTYHRTNYQSY